MEGLEYLEIVLAFLSFWYMRKLRYDDGLPWNWPLVGMMPWLFSNVNRVHNVLTHILDRSGGTFLIKGPWFTNMDMLFTVDPANIRYVLSDGYANFHKGQEFKEIFDVLGDGIVNAEFDLWKIQRKHSQFLFSLHQFRKFLRRISTEKIEIELIAIMDHVSQQGQVVDMQDLFQRLTFDTTCMFVTGYDPGCLDIKLHEVPFSKAMDETEEVIFTRHVMPQTLWKLMRWLNIGSEKTMSHAKKVIDDVLYAYITRRRKQVSTRGNTFHNDAEGDGADLLTLYITEEDKSLGLENNDEFMKDIVLNHILAGRDTTSSALTWFLWLVITHPQVESKIQAELEASRPKNEAEKRKFFSDEELSELPYLHGAISEALRLYPPVPFQHKEPIKADVLPTGHRVHPKQRVMFSLYAMGRMTTLWGKDCLEFKPERWISKDGTLKHVPAYKFTAFSGGPRACLGKKVAYTQMKAVAAALIYNYKFKMVEGHKVIPNLSMILLMTDGLKVRITDRWS
ncbi:alkane hydroxylase MAH1-like [Apium graveolens]|uniref:alkane hydroxylase MAH1-like n=1 Tax=Apium graveolens TaxID=4045 RepID=UPI003D795986